MGSSVDDHLPDAHQIVTKVLKRSRGSVFSLRLTQSMPDLPTPFDIQGAVGRVCSEIIAYTQFQIIDRKTQNSHGSVGGGPFPTSAERTTPGKI